MLHSRSGLVAHPLGLFMPAKALTNYKTTEISTVVTWQKLTNNSVRITVLIAITVSGRFSSPIGKLPEQLRVNPETPLRASQGDHGLDFGLLRHLQRVFHLDTQVSDRAFHLGMAQQNLHSPEILVSSVYQRGLGSPH